MNGPLRHEDIEELLGAYALDAIDVDEREQVERHLRECPRCRAEVADHREVAAMLAYGGAPAPAGVWDRIVGSLEEAPPALRLEIGPPPDASVVPFRPRPRRLRTLALAVSAAAALLIGGLAVEVVHQHRQLDRIQAALPSEAMVKAIADRSSRKAELVSPDGTVRVFAVASDQGGYLVGDDLPALADGRTYQLWGTSGAKVISLGVLGSNPSIVPFAVDGSIDGLAITSEAAPVESSANPPVVAGGFT